VEIPTAAVGLITEAEQADGIVADGEADAVFLARALLRNPNWIRQAADELGHRLPHPRRYARAFTVSGPVAPGVSGR
jgi:2,4-dienoyl-CoA reductase-like NADH-dependent reductase (Old Yellow Enzyme family)